MESSNVGSAPPAGSSAAPTDPFQFLSQHVQRRVAITLLPHDAADVRDGGAVVTGTLLSVDDLCNVMVANWICSDTVSAALPQQQPQRKRTKTEAYASSGFGGEEGESLRLIRGAQIASISLLA